MNILIDTAKRTWAEGEWQDGDKNAATVTKIAPGEAMSNRAEPSHAGISLRRIAIILTLALAATPVMAQTKQYIMHQDSSVNYFTYYTDAFVANRAKCKRLTSFPNLLWCGKLGGAVENCEEMYHDDTGFRSQDACETQKHTWTTFDASTLHCAYQDEVGGAWNFE